MKRDQPVQHVWLGVSGAKRSGKDTVGLRWKTVLETKGVVCRLDSFAYSMKRCLQWLFGFTHEQLWGGDEHKEKIDPFWNVSPRFVMQRFGTEFLCGTVGTKFFPREIGPNVHCKTVEKRVSKLAAPTVLILTDVRMLHEEVFLASKNGRILGLVVPGVSTGSAYGNHASETESLQIKVHAVVENPKKNLTDLYAAVDSVLERFLESA